MLALALGPRIAAADGERAVSLGLGYATFSAPGVAMDNMPPPTVSPSGGGALSIAYERMIGSDLGLRAELSGGAFHGGNAEMQSATSYAALADAGLVFRFDVLKYVPYAFVGLGVVASGGGPLDGGFDAVIAIGGGLDWLVRRERSYGLEARVASFGGDITVVTIGLRGTVRWDAFTR